MACIVKALEEAVSDVLEKMFLASARELANMICGSVLSRIESSAGFRLATPEIASAGLPDDGAAATAWTIETGHGPLTATIYMEATA